MYKYAGVWFQHEAARARTPRHDAGDDSWICALHGTQTPEHNAALGTLRNRCVPFLLVIIHATNQYREPNLS